MGEHPYTYPVVEADAWYLWPLEEDWRGRDQLMHTAMRVIGEAMRRRVDVGVGRGEHRVALHADVRECTAEHGLEPDHPDGTTDQRVRFLLGRAMTELRGRVAAARSSSSIELTGRPRKRFS